MAAAAAVVAVLGQLRAPLECASLVGRQDGRTPGVFNQLKWCYEINARNKNCDDYYARSFTENVFDGGYRLCFYNPDSQFCAASERFVCSPPPPPSFNCDLLVPIGGGCGRAGDDPALDAVGSQGGNHICQHCCGRTGFCGDGDLYCEPWAGAQQEFSYKLLDPQREQCPFKPRTVEHQQYCVVNPNTNHQHCVRIEKGKSLHDSQVKRQLARLFAEDQAHGEWQPPPEPEEPITFVATPPVFEFANPIFMGPGSLRGPGDVQQQVAVG